MMYSIKKIDDIENEHLKEAWNRIYEGSNLCPQASYTWNLLWWQHFQKKNRKLHILVALNNDEIVIIAPLMKESIFGFSQLKFIGSGLTDFHYFLSKNKDHFNNISPLLFKHISSSNCCNLINLEQIPYNSETYNFVSKNKTSTTREMVRCPIVNLNSNTWEDYIAKLTHKTRHQWKKKYNNLRKLGKIKVDMLDKVDKKYQYIDELFLLHIRRWDIANSESKFTLNSIQQFVKSVVMSMEETVIYVLYLNDKIISYRLGFRQYPIYYDFNTSFDPLYAKYSVGMVLNGLVINDLLDKGYKKICYMRGNYDWKRRWMTDNETIINYQVLIPNTPFIGFLGVSYYSKWKWRLKKNLSGLINNRFIQKIKLKY